MTENDNTKNRKIIRSFYIPVSLIDEIEAITMPVKGMNVNKVVNESLELWLKQYRTKGGKKA